MIGRHVARYNPRFWYFRALPVTFGNHLATAGRFFHSLRGEAPNKKWTLGDFCQRTYRLACPFAQLLTLQ